MNHADTSGQRQRGNVRLALLCALAGAVAVLVWNTRQSRLPEAPSASGHAQAGPLPAGAAPLAHAPAQPAAAPAAPTRGDSPGSMTADTTDPGATPQTDADGFSPDYGALVDDLQRQRALDPLVDE